MAERILSDADHRRIADAIRRAEESTSGEIYCVLARRSDSYFFPSAFFAAAMILLAMGVAGFLIEGSWIDPPHHVLPLSGIAAFASAILVLALVPRLRILMVPRHLRYRRASANAVGQFLGRNIHRTADRTGVLIFVSLEERYAEVVADAGVNAVVTQESWNALVGALVEAASRDALADGFVAAVEAAGRVLAAHFPPERGQQNELSDHLVEL
jgi:putative membrane protein